MASTFNAACCAVAALAFWTALGFPIVRRLLSPSLALPLAPLAGWAMHSVIALPIFFFIPFSTFHVAAVAALAFPASWLVLRVDRWFDGRAVAAGQASPSRPADGLHDPHREVRVSRWAWAGAMVLAMACASAILPKHLGGAVILSDQIFDHAKVSMINDMARLGLPPGNPYYAHDGGSGRLSYYYLLHFSAAELSRVLHVSGWEADIAMTFFSAFTSLALMMGIAVRYSGRATASIWVVLLALSSTSRVLLDWTFGDSLEAWLPQPGGWGGWLFQSAWVPQHLVSTSCVLLAVLLMGRVASRVGLLPVIGLATVMAAAFESSTWVGGIVFALVCIVVVPLMIVRAERSARPAFVVGLCAAALLTILLVWPFLVDQIRTSSLRNSGIPIDVRNFEVLGRAVPEGIRALWNEPAYWFVFLPIALPAVYVSGMVVLIGSLVGRGPLSSKAVVVQALAAVAILSLVISWLLVSTIADNNDLGWRAALLGCSALIIFAAIGLSSWIAVRKRIAVALAIGALALGLPEAFQQIGRNLSGHFQPDGRIFAGMPALWEHVRAHSSIDERIASNPMALKNMTPWPVNISWSLLANRRSCYAGWELTQVFTAVPHDRLRMVDAQFNRVFAGEASDDDMKDLATVYDCSAAVVTPQDGAWTNDPFRASPLFSLVEEEAGHWRIYRRRAASGVKTPG